MVASRGNSGNLRSARRVQFAPEVSEQISRERVGVVTSPNGAMRPAHAPHCQDAAFLAEDDKLLDQAERLLSCVLVLDGLSPDFPVIYCSSGYAARFLCKEQHQMLFRKAFQACFVNDEGAAELEANLTAGQPCTALLTMRRDDDTMVEEQVAAVTFYDQAGCRSKHLLVHLPSDLIHKSESGSGIVDEGSSLEISAALVQQLFRCFALTAPHEAFKAEITAANPALQELVQQETGDLVGNSLLSIFAEQTEAGAISAVSAAQRDNFHSQASKCLCFRRDGSPFWANVVMMPLESPSNQGSFGIVRLGQNTVTEELVAVKTLPSTGFRSIAEVEQVQEEMHVLGQLKHPNIIRLLDAIQAPDHSWLLVMEYASGGSLTQYMAKQDGNKLPEGQACAFFRQMIDAVHYSHRRSVVHRDLKPENILLDEAGNLKIADFGLAGIISPLAEKLTLQCGTPEFTAPEIIQGKEYNGSSVDIWSLGVILYEMLMGQVPFKGSTQAALFKAICKGFYLSLPSALSAPCRELVARMLTTDPEVRISIEKVELHPWISKRTASGLMAALEDESLSDSSELAHFSSLKLVLPTMSMPSAARSPVPSPAAARLESFKSGPPASLVSTGSVSLSTAPKAVPKSPGIKPALKVDVSSKAGASPTSSAVFSPKSPAAKSPTPKSPSVKSPARPGFDPKSPVPLIGAKHGASAASSKAPVAGKPSSTPKRA
ncbi:hypothetical protein WJX73_005899 [Symbiochloris irregularis]|uniref:Protein kinase domain-containing protein n=1 Tax=Symbiochloris irregularis TaxID=706552 RepID=A0AAW1NW95_9CHLO